MPTPCNSLNVKFIKISNLASYTSLTNNDLFLTIQSSGGSLYSRKSTIGDLVSFITTNPNGSYSGSFTGSFKGNVTGRLYGTSSYTLTSSYLLQTSQNTTNQLGYFNGTRLTSTPGLVFQSNVGGYKILNISSSQPFNYLNIASRGASGYNQSGIILANYNSSEPYPTYDSWTLLSNRSGSLVFVAPIGSNQFSSSGVVAKSATGECYGMVQMRNGFYFWPFMSSNTPSRDGGIGIGVQPPTEPTGSFSKYLRAKLQINMFSGSGEGGWSPQATVENRATAILVNYGSGSATTSLVPTFYVSASGNTYIKGKLNVVRGVTGSFYGTGFKTLNSKSVSFWGTSSHAVSSSFAQTASYVGTISLSGFPTSTYAAGTSTNTVYSFITGTNEGGVGTYCYAITHGFGSAPGLIRATLYCNVNDSNVGYVAGDEVDLNSAEIDALDANLFAAWTNSTYAAISVTNILSGNTFYMPKKTGGGWATPNLNNWQFRIRVWK